MRVFHVQGYSQYLGTCKFHLFRDCRHLTRKRTEFGWDRTGLTTETDYDKIQPQHMCKACVARQARERKPSVTRVRPAPGARCR